MDILKNRPMKQQFGIVIASTVVLILTAQLVSYSLISNLILTRNNTYTSELMSSVESSVMSQLDSIGRILNATAYTESIQRFLVEKEMPMRTKLAAEASESLERMLSLKDGIERFVVIGSNDNNLNLGFFPDNVAKFHTLIQNYSDSGRQNQQNFGIAIKTLDFISEKPRSFIVMMQAVNGLYYGPHYTRNIGHIFILIDPSTFISQIEGAGSQESGFLYLVDSQNIVLASNDTASVGNNFDANETQDHILTIREISETGLQLVSSYPKSELARGLRDVQMTNIFLFIAVILTITIAFLTISSNIINPIRRFVSFFNELRMKKEDMLKERIDLSGYAEISMVATKFNQMMDQIDELTEDLIESNSQLYESEISKQRAEMAFLNSQINPHFLYNTLECIQGIAANKGVHEIKDMTAALSQIFRYSIKGGDEVSIREEFGIVERYLLIQKIRFEDRFDVIYEVDEQLLDYKIKKMLLQPIVENAVFHGLELMMERGLLHIQLSILEEKKLLMKIVDNGMGIKEERLLHIRKELDNVEKREDAIGLINVHKRIVLAYGKEYGLRIESEENKGTVVTLLLPWLGGDNRVHDSVG